MKTCITCHQPIHPTEGSIMFNQQPIHENPAHCVAATVRNCAEIIEVIGDSGKQIGGTFSEGGLALSRIAVQAIRRAYPTAFAEEEGR